MCWIRADQANAERARFQQHQTTQSRLQVSREFFETQRSNEKRQIAANKALASAQLAKDKLAIALAQAEEKYAVAIRNVQLEKDQGLSLL